MRLSTKYYQLEYKDATVRWVQSGNVEIIRMIYSAVRDHNWGTLAPEILEEKIYKNIDGFEIKVMAEYQDNNIHFVAQYQIIGKDKSLLFEMTGTALTTFKTCRVGICVLHPINECAGKKCHIIHDNNTSEDIIFPINVSPYQPMKNIRGMKWQPSRERHAELLFSGDIFEMEDQRNWTDASYKTYCRPLELPFPFQLKKNEKISQRVELLIDAGLHRISNENTVGFKIDSDKKFKIPNLGTCVSSRNTPLTNNEIRVLKALPFEHLRCEAKLFNPKWKSILQNALSDSNLIGWPLFLLLYISDNYKEELNHLKNFCSGRENQFGNIMIVGRNHLPNDMLFDKVYDDIKQIFKETLIGTGVNAYFAELNRNRPKTSNHEFIGFTICPQVHAFDNDSLIENLEAQKYVVESAIELFSPKQIYVSPITLSQRFNVVATSNEEKPISGQLPSQVDVRQNSIFAAKWLLGSLKYLSQAGANLVTYFETVGWRGLIQGHIEPPNPEKFEAQAGDVFPVYHLLKELRGYNRVIYSESKLPLVVDGIVLQNQNKIKLIIVNFSVSEKVVEIQHSIQWSDFRTLLSDLKITKNKNRIVLPPEEIVVSEHLYDNYVT